MPGTLAVTAQSPKETSVRVRSRIGRSCAGPPRADRALDQADVDALGELLDVDQRAVDQVGPLGEVEQPLVQVEEGHVAAGAAVEPDRGEALAWSSLGLLVRRAAR